MQIGSVTSTSAANQAAPAYAADDTPSPDFANLLAGYAAKAARHSERSGADLKGPEAARSMDRSAAADRAAADRAAADRAAADRTADNREAEPAPKRSDRHDDAAAKRSERAPEKKADKPAEDTADAAPAKPDETKAKGPAKDAAADADAAPAEEKGKDKAAETQVDPLLLAAAPAAAAATGPAVTGHAAAQAAAQAGGQAGAENAMDAALRALQQDGLSPEAQQAALEAAKAAAQNGGKGDAKSAKLTAQVSSDASSQLSLVDTSSLFAEMLHVEGEEGLLPELAAEMLGEHGPHLQNPLAGGVMVFDLASQQQAAAGNGGQPANGLAAVAGSAAPAATQGTQHAAQTQAARHPQAMVPPGEQVAVHIKRAASEGLDTISIKLDPGNLGKVEVTMEVSSDGRLLAVIAADKPDTLAMLQKDAQQLEQSLRDSGLKTSQDSLNFMLREQGQNGQGGNDGRGRRGGRGRGDDIGEAGAIGGDARAMAQAANAQRAADRGGLDIRI